MENIATNNKIEIGMIILINIIIISIITVFLYFNIVKLLLYDTFIELGNKFINQPKYEKAIVEFEKAIHTQQNSTNLRIGNANGYRGLNKIESAVEGKEMVNIK